MIAIMTKAQFDALPEIFPSGIGKGVPAESTDSRLALPHNYVQADIDFLLGRGITVTESWPADWVNSQ